MTATPVMAVTLFAHALGLKSGAKSTGVAIIHHDARFMSESDRTAGFKTRLFQQRKAASYIDKNDYAKESMSLSLQPVATAHLTLSLVLEFDVRPNLEAALHFLRGARLSGGVIESFGSAEIFHEYDEALLEAIPGNGFWVIDRKDLISLEQPLQSLVSALGSADHSWLTPLVCGYALTSSPQAGVVGVRSLPNGEYVDHAFAEPLLGLGQYVSIREYESDDHIIPFWRNRWLSDSIYVSSTNH